MNEKCLIIGHLGLGDQFTINGLIRYYTTLYNYVYVLCKKNNMKSINQMYIDTNNIISIYIDTIDNLIDNNHYLFKEYKNYDIIKLGLYNNNWYTIKSNLTIGGLSYSFFKTFYEQINLNYNIRYKYEKINRYKNNEFFFFKEVMINYNKYIFLHNDINFKINISNYISNDISNDIPIFHPNFNYYEKENKYYNLWNGKISYNIFDYCYILENAEEIHVSFSSFFSLCMFLDLSFVKKKYIYTDITNIKDYHERMNNWIIIYI